MNTQNINNSNNESKNGMSQVINILTGETKKIRCHYLSKRTDKPVSRVLTLERLNHPALTAAGVTAWAERFNDGVNRFDWIRVSIQLTDNLCYTPNCANHDLPSIEHYNDYDEVNRRNVDNFFQSIAAKPAKMMTGEDWPNMAVIAAYRAAGRDKEAETLTAARDTYNARREADKEAWNKKYAAQQTYYNSPKPKNFADLTELEKAQYLMETAQECAKEHPELDWNDVLERAANRLEKARQEAERQERYEARCKELEAEALAQMPYKVGDTVTSRYGDTGRVIEMHPEITGDTDSPHLVYEYDGKPTVNVVILDTNGKRRCAHWSVYTLEPAPEIKAIDVLQVGTMVTMPGVIGGLRVEEIDRKGDRVICVDGCKERHTYKGLDYFTATAEEIRIPEWLRICQYFYIGPKGVKTNRVLCIDIIPCSDQEKPVVIVYSDHEGKERKIFLSPGLDSVNRTDRERLTAKYREQIVNNMQLGCGCMVGDGYEGRKDSKWVKVRKAYTNDSLSPRDWTYCVSWYDVEPTDGDGYRETLRECENGVTLEQAARAMAIFEQENKPFFIAGRKYRCIRDVKMKKGGEVTFKAGKVYEQSCEPSRWCGWLENEQGERHGWPQPVYIPQEVKTWGTKPEDIDPRQYFEAVA